jgi:glycosyltransferase involved in cell wall biosynthesis
VYSALREHSFDLIHDHNDALGVAFAGHACPDVPRLATLHGELRSSVVQLLEELDGCVGLVSISQSQRRTAPSLRWAGMVHNAVETHAPVGGREAKGDYIIQLARINPDKGQHLAIEAARRLGLPLILAGKLDANQASRRYFRERIKSHLGRGVTWIRDLRGKAKWRLLAGARAMLFPLRWEEPFGLAMAEAMVVGTPVIAYARGAAPELVEEGVTGFLARDVHSMVEAFRRIDEIDPEACARRSRERFNGTVMARGYEELYREALERSSPVPLAQAR